MKPKLYSVAGLRDSINTGIHMHHKNILEPFLENDLWGDILPPSGDDSINLKDFINHAIWDGYDAT